MRILNFTNEAYIYIEYIRINTIANSIHTNITYKAYKPSGRHCSWKPINTIFTFWICFMCQLWIEEMRKQTTMQLSQDKDN